MSAKQNTGPDQRRGKRYRQRLPVDLHSQRGSKRLWTHDVGAHGLFLLMNEPPRERHVLKLTIHLPQGPIGVVAHGTHTSPRGMGVQFFALAGEAKRRWDGFVGELNGQPAPTPSAEAAAGPAFGAATFVVKLKSVQALRDFAQHCLVAGGTYLRTPVLKAVGSPVTLTMVHPHTEQELRLSGVIARLHQQRPKGMEIQFSAATRALAEVFEKFLQTGESPVFEVDLDDDDLVVAVQDERRAPPEEDVAFDIDVLDDTALEVADLDDEHKFDWEQVSDELLIDIGIGDEVDSFVPPATDPNLRYDGRKEPLPASQEGDPIPVELDDFARPFMQVVVSCDACDMLETELDVGAAPGALGLVAEYRPYFCPTCATLVTCKRLLSGEERATARARLTDQAALEAPVPVRLLLEVSDLSDAPMCPGCKGKLRQPKQVQALDELLAKLERGDDVGDARVECAVCKKGHWTIERHEPPLKADA